VSAYILEENTKRGNCGELRDDPSLGMIEQKFPDQIASEKTIKVKSAGVSSFVGREKMQGEAVNVQGHHFVW